MALGIEASYILITVVSHTTYRCRCKPVLFGSFFAHTNQKRRGEKKEREDEENQTRQLLNGMIRHDSDTMPQYKKRKTGKKSQNALEIKQ